MGSLFSPNAEETTLVINTARRAGKVSPLHYGLMTEEINYSYDGGLYAELVRNRAFLDDPEIPVHWSAVNGATMALDPQTPLNKAIPTSLRVNAPVADAGVANAGWWGVPVKPGTTYKVSFFAKASPGFRGPLTVALQGSDDNTLYAEATTPELTGEWKQYNLKLTTAPGVQATAIARLILTAMEPGEFRLGLVSLFPPTWKNRPNGLRPDLMQMLVDLKPKFLRFPGGNYLEGQTIETRFKWWETLGPISERPGHQGPWRYRSSDGMGLMEFLLWCEDMGAEPVLGLFAGYSLKGDFVQPGRDLEPFIQEALDEIEYVIGPVTSKWGARRAEDGHIEPFPLRYVEIGNEDWFDKSGSYDARFAQFHDAIKEKYPELKTISSIGTEHPIKIRVCSRKPDVLDEHYYFEADEFLTRSPEFFACHDRNGPEIFIGEWAAHEGSIKPWNPESANCAPTPNFKAALGDAAFMAAMERHSDLVTMQCYAPLLVNVNERQWRPNLIGYDALAIYGSPSYYAFRMFSTNVGDEILEIRFSAGSLLQGSATRDSRSGEIHLKLVNPTSKPQPLRFDFQDNPPLAATALVEMLSADPSCTNTIADPIKVAPIKSTLAGVNPSFATEIPAHSIVVLTFINGSRQSTL